MFGVKREEVTGGMKRLQNENLHNMYLLLYIIWLMLHVACVVEMVFAYRILVGENPKRTDHLGGLHKVGRIVLELILKKLDVIVLFPYGTNTPSCVIKTI
jgi:hypothetical protein